MVKYARLKMRTNDRGCIELITSNYLDGLLDGESCKHKYVGTIDIPYIDELLEEARPEVIYIDPITLSNLTVAFYRKYQNVIKEVLYVPNQLY